MHITLKKIVTVHYILTDDSGNIIENTYDLNKPTVYLHGRGKMLRGFEEQVSGATVGQKLKFRLMATDAYGLRNVTKTQRIPVKYLQHEGKLTAGKPIRVNTDSGIKHGTIIKVGKFNADVDMNHPLAGKNLTFDVEVMDIRDATDSEIEQGQCQRKECCS